MPEKIITAEYSEEMQKSYLNYSMSVITARAIPDARDGLKPVQRRVLYDMAELKVNSDKPHRKSARIVGDTMGKYHPHGDSSIYDTLVVMSQSFKKGMALVDGHGNFGSIEGDGAAAMRYTEARLMRFAEEVYLKDLDKTVNFIPNYDESEKEPEVLPVRVPNLLINGAEGIAVGMSTSIPPHNLGEVIDCILCYIKDPDVPVEELLKVMPGPDFPTGGIIANKDELHEIYETGVGKLKLRGTVEVELGRKKSDRDKLVITQIPYTMIGTGINKFLTDVAMLVESKKLPEVTDISNQSGKDGIRIVLDLKKDADVERVKNILYKKTRLEDTFGVNMLAIAGGRPETLNLKGILSNYLEFQYENTAKKYKALLEKELEKSEVQEGLIRACDIIDLIIAVLRGAKNVKDAKACLMTGDESKITFRDERMRDDAKQLSFTERQADAILQMRLLKLIGLEILALKKEYAESQKKIKEYKKILSGRDSMSKVICEDLENIKKEFAIERKTVIENGREAAFEEKKQEASQLVFAMDRFGYCKCMEIAAFEKSRLTQETEYARAFYVMSDDRVLIFTDAGNVHQLKVCDVPMAKARDKGIPVDNISNLDSRTEEIVFAAPMGALTGQVLLLATENGFVKRTDAKEYFLGRRTIAATKLSEGDRLCGVYITGQETDAIFISDDDYILRVSMEEIPEQKRASVGVRGMKLSAGAKLSSVHFSGSEKTLTCRGREVSLSRLKLSRRDSRGSKIRQ